MKYEEGVNLTHHHQEKLPSKSPALLKLSMLLGTLGPSLLGNLLSGEVIVKAGSWNKKGKGIVIAGYGKEWDF